mmetsp:Transcript_33533/g.52184  ORF Transcript_33533/g.52184 Transcript_33533/m.52184 type:complete len:86 (-) Transcript_33533:98-355(-)
MLEAHTPCACRPIEVGLQKDTQKRREAACSCLSPQEQEADYQLTNQKAKTQRPPAQENRTGRELLSQAQHRKRDASQSLLTSLTL